jgi:hypothetical protein
MGDESSGGESNWNSLDHGAGRPGASEGGEQVFDGVLDTGVGVQHHLVGGVVNQPDR